MQMMVKLQSSFLLLGVNIKINLEIPYSLDWDTGYLIINKENRKILLLKKSNKRMTTSFSRYLMSVHLKRYLNKHEHVDHIDNDKTNDVIENLQILTQKENNIKESKKRGKTVVELICPICENIFFRRKGLTNLVASKKSQIICCSKICSFELKKQNYTIEERNIILNSNVIKIHFITE